MRGGEVMQVCFTVMHVSRALLSVGELQRQGWDVIFSERSALKRKEHVIPLVWRGGLSYLPARFPDSEKPWPSVMDRMLEVSESMIKIEEKEKSKTRWRVMEYFCESNSLMSEWFLRKGHNATRLGLPDWGLSTEAAARAVVRCTRQALEAGEHTLLCHGRRYHVRRGAAGSTSTPASVHSLQPRSRRRAVRAPRC